MLGARRSELYQAYTNAVVAKAMADYAWRATADTLRTAKEAAEAAAVAEYQAAVKAPPRLGDSLGELGAADPAHRVDPETEAVLNDLATAQQEERQAYTVLTAAISAEQQASTAYSAVEKEFKRKEIAFLELKRRLAELQSEADRLREIQEQNLGDYSPGKSNAGLVAAAKAQKAVMFALSQRGKPYRWGDEGPNTYDCSGLMLASYKAAGITLNRVAKDQYYGTRAKSVNKYALLPGDLVFFATDPSDWRTIHHVGMYLGEGKMVHAPRTGDVVRPASVSLSSIDFATRVVDAVPAPNQPNPTQTTRPSPTKTTSPRPTATTSPSSSSSPSAPASPSPQAGTESRRRSRRRPRARRPARRRRRPPLRHPRRDPGHPANRASGVTPTTPPCYSRGVRGEDRYTQRVVLGALGAPSSVPAGDLQRHEAARRGDAPPERYRFDYARPCPVPVRLRDQHRCRGQGRGREGRRQGSRSGENHHHGRRRRRGRRGGRGHRRHLRNQTSQLRRVGSAARHGARADPRRHHQPFEIQAATLPDALAGRDVLGRGQTGSGKTLAFGLPLLARLAEGRPRRRPRPRPPRRHRPPPPTPAPTPSPDRPPTPESVAEPESLAEPKPVAERRASPSPSPTASPVAPPPPADEGGISPWLIALLILLVVAGIAAFIWWQRQQSGPPPPPPPTPVPPPEPPDGPPVAAAAPPRRKPPPVTPAETTATWQPARGRPGRRRGRGGQRGLAHRDPSARPALRRVQPDQPGPPRADVAAERQAGSLSLPLAPARGSRPVPRLRAPASRP